MGRKAIIWGLPNGDNLRARASEMAAKVTTSAV